MGGKPDRELKLQASYQSRRSSFHLVYFETPEGLAGSCIPGDSTSLCSSTGMGAGQFSFSIRPWAGGRARGSGFAFSIPWRGSLGAAVEGAGPSCLFSRVLPPPLAAQPLLLAHVGSWTREAAGHKTFLQKGNEGEDGIIPFGL